MVSARLQGQGLPGGFLQCSSRTSYYFCGTILLHQQGVLGLPAIVQSHRRSPWWFASRRRGVSIPAAIPFLTEA